MWPTWKQDCAEWLGGGAKVFWVAFRTALMSAFFEVATGNKAIIEHDQYWLVVRTAAFAGLAAADSYFKRNPRPVPGQAADGKDPV